MRTPTQALLWEAWRLSRLHLAMSILASTILGAVFIVLIVEDDLGATLAMLLAAFLAFTAWVWAARGDRKGFVMHLGFTRPVPTWLLVGVPMGYVGVSVGIAYLVPVILLRALFGFPFPMLPVAALTATLSILFLASRWWTGSAALQIVGSTLLYLLGMIRFFAGQTEANDLPPDRWSEMFAYTATDYGLLALASLVAAGFTIAGVSRQRIGADGVAAFRRPSGTEPAPRLARLHRFAERWRLSCPTSSPIHAQLWFETIAVGLPVLRSGLLIALGVAVLVWMMEVFDVSVAARASIAIIVTVTPILPLLTAIRSMLGLRRLQGRAYLTPFAAAVPTRTIELVALKLGVAAVTIVIAWSAIAFSTWASLTATGLEPQAFTALAQSLIRSPAGEVLWGTAVLGFQLFGLLACLAGIQTALIVRRRELFTGVVAFLAYGVGLVSAMYWGGLDGSAVMVSFWLLSAAVFLGAVHLLRRTARSGVFSPSTVTIAVSAWLGYAALHLRLFPTIGLLNPGDVPLAVSVAVLTTLIPLAGLALAPWSLARLRHG